MNTTDDMSNKYLIFLLDQGRLAIGEYISPEIMEAVYFEQGFEYSVGILEPDEYKVIGAIDTLI